MRMQTKWVGVLGSLLFALSLTGRSSGGGDIWSTLPVEDFKPRSNWLM